ncbi:hypothetical protein BCR36DRAFT_411850 [Piromyces finnis]|uniref:Agd3 CBM87 domain-containing protein n=1 Tax=Piromyces finnis TaxID=1754191 RepID=A0A1Y1VAK0_9FUNG|nr:hypothetical protein BCR36DRAFT_411850 [Piromyces finnis]|eukprot:ORX51383.1 hypothetical protein BCR36DRAFT_411850 [Piromyces finnis]
MYFKLFSKLSLILFGSASVICQQLNKNILIVTTDDNESEDLATNSILETMEKYSINRHRIKIKKSGILDEDLHNALYDDNGNAKYKAIVFPNGRISYNDDDIWTSAIKPLQWEEIYQYSRSFGSRLVFLNEYPSNYTATMLYSDNDNNNIFTSLQKISAAPGTTGAEAINSANLDTNNIYHFPAKLQNTETVFAEPLLYFNENDVLPEKTIAAVSVNNAGAKYAAYFMAFGGWSKTSHALNILWLSWATEMDLKDLSSTQDVTTEQALLNVKNNISSDAERNRKLGILFITLSSLLTFFYLL